VGCEGPYAVCKIIRVGWPARICLEPGGQSVDGRGLTLRLLLMFETGSGEHYVPKCNSKGGLWRLR